MNVAYVDVWYYGKNGELKKYRHGGRSVNARPFNSNFIDCRICQTDDGKLWRASGAVQPVGYVYEKINNVIENYRPFMTDAELLNFSREFYEKTMREEREARERN